MNGKIHRFEDDLAGITPPAQFTWPFHYVPHRLVRLAAGQVERYIGAHSPLADDLLAGKMLGVLVVSDADGSLGFLAAFSGLLGGTNRHPYFVPPVYDLLQPSGEFRRGEAEIVAMTHEIDRLASSPRLTSLQTELQAAIQTRNQAIAEFKAAMATAKARRDDLRSCGGLTPEQHERLLDESRFLKAELKRLRRHHDEAVKAAEIRLEEYRGQIDSLRDGRHKKSDALQRRLFDLFVISNARGERRTLTDIFAPAVPPGGAGECCAPKLLQYAYDNHLKPVCMGEFWWGRQPEGEVRHQGHFYPACRSKCLPILSFMLQGLDVEPNPLAKQADEGRLEVIYDDPWLTVVNKPAGMLTTPGKLLDDSLETRFRRQFPEASGPVVVHRLDQETSGLVVLAKNRQTHKALQELFATHQVEKTYIALLDGVPDNPDGTISLPLRPDVDDRPRQRVDFVHGKAAETRYTVLEQNNGRCLVALCPKTGRTHQLRVHCSHPLGLGIPIAGDMLYGTAAGRLMLHAARIRFRHPHSGTVVTAEAPVPFSLPGSSQGANDGPH